MIYNLSMVKKEMDDKDLPAPTRLQLWYSSSEEDITPPGHLLQVDILWDTGLEEVTVNYIPGIGFSRWQKRSRLQSFHRIPTTCDIALGWLKANRQVLPTQPPELCFLP